MANVAINNITDTWNSSGTTFTGIKFNVTDTASAAASNLIDLQVGGESKFSVDKSGFIAATGLGLNASNRAAYVVGTGFVVTQLGYFAASFGFQKSMFWTTAAVGWTSNGVNLDLSLSRDAADTLAQRNGANAQTFRVYNTFTDASNYERGFLRWSSGRFQIGQEAAGSGASRSLNIFQAHNRQIEFSSAGLYIWHDTGSSATSGFIPGELRLCTNKLGFGSGNVSTSSDAGIVRTAAAKLKVTDGSTGTGQLVFIVPTTDPAVAGALWNDAGTLKVSAG